LVFKKSAVKGQVEVKILVISMRRKIKNRTAIDEKGRKKSSSKN